MLVQLTGLLAGAIHVLAGPDHLATVAPLALGRSRPAWRTGFLWGTGHATGVLMIGLLALSLRESLPLDAISSWSERLVGVAMIGIGAWGLRQAFRHRLHAHKHTHDGKTHTHIHLHDPAMDHGSGSSHLHSHLSVGMGILHAFAGSANILGVLPALAIPTFSGGLAYLVFFGLGSIAAMTAFAQLVVFSMERMKRTGLNAYRLFLTGSSTAAIAVGGLWLIV